MFASVGVTRKVKRIFAIVLSICMVCSIWEGFVVYDVYANTVVFSGGDGTKKNPYQITDALQLDKIRDDLKANYIVMNDIDLSSFDDWSPIGTDRTCPFEGTFNGQGHSICNLKINTEKSNYTGLFGICNENSVIKNVKLEKVNIDFNHVNKYPGSGFGCNVGALAGRAIFINNCLVSGKVVVNGSCFDDLCVGGVVGYCEDNSRSRNNTIYNCDNKADICVDGLSTLKVGGICGMGVDEITSCNNHGEIHTHVREIDETKDSRNGAFIFCGGICGYNAPCNNCNNYGDVSGVTDFFYSRWCPTNANCNIGGIIGLGNWVFHCVNYGNVSSYAKCLGTSYAGGITGCLEQNEYHSGIKYCYNLGKVISSTCQKKNDSGNGYYDVEGICGRISGNGHGKECYSIFDTLVNGKLVADNEMTNIYYQYNGTSMDSEKINSSINLLCKDNSCIKDYSVGKCEVGDEIKADLIIIFDDNVEYSDSNEQHNYYTNRYCGTNCDYYVKETISGDIIHWNGVGFQTRIEDNTLIIEDVLLPKNTMISVILGENAIKVGGKQFFGLMTDNVCRFKVTEDRVEVVKEIENVNDSATQIVGIETHNVPQLNFYVRELSEVFYNELSNVTVDVGEFGTTTSDEHGKASVDNNLTEDAIKQVKVRLSKEGYRDYFYTKTVYHQDVKTYLFQENDNILMSRIENGDDVNPYYSNILVVDEQNGRMTDVSKHNWTYREKYAKANQTIQVNVQWNGKTPQSYSLYQENGKIYTNTDGIFAVNLDTDFLPKSPIYAEAVATDGTIIKEKLKITIDKEIKNIVPDNGITLFDEEGEEPLSDEIAFLAKQKVKLSMKNIEISTTIEKNKVKIMIGVPEKGECFGNKEWGEWKKFCEMQPKDLNLTQWKNVLQSIETNYTYSLKAETDVCGYLEGMLDEKGNALLTGSLKIQSDVKTGLTTQYVVGVLPVYTSISVGIEGGAEGKITYDLTNKKFVSEKTDVEFSIEPKLSAVAGVGVAAVAGVEVEGVGSIPIKVKVGSDDATMELDGKISIIAKVLKWKYELELVSRKKQIFSGTKKMKKASIRKMKPKDFKLQEDKKTKNTWLGNVTTKRKLTAFANHNSTEKVVEQDMNEDAEVQMVDNGITTMLLWLEHDNNRTNINSSKLVYSIYDKVNDTWSSPATVEEDGTADYQPKVTCKYDKIYVTWLNLKQILQDDETLINATKTGEIKVAEWNGTGFNAPVSVSNENGGVMAPQVGVMENGKVRVVYLSNDSNNLLLTEGKNAIVSAIVNGNTVESRTTLVEDAGFVNSLAISQKDAGEVSYTKDTDGLMDTLEDREIFKITSNGTVEQVTNNTLMDSNPQYVVNDGNSIAFWYSNHSIVMKKDGEQPQKIYEDSTLTDSFSVISGAAGEMAVIWTNNDENGKKQIKGLLYDSTNNKWSEEVQISDTDANVYDPSGSFENNGKLALAYKKKNSQQTDLCVLTAEKKCDLSLENAYCNEADFTKGTTQKIAMKIKNEGMKTASGFNVNVGETAITVSETILPGETKIIDVDYQVPDDFTYGDLVLSVSEGTDTNVGNNTYSMKVGYTDLEMNVSSLNYDENVLSQIKVTNMNCVDTDATLEVHADSLDGAIIDSVSLGTVKKNEVKELEYMWSQRTVGYSSDVKCLYFKVVSEKEENYKNNNYDFVVVNNKSDTSEGETNDIKIQNIILNDNSSVTMDTATLQLAVQILPENATNKTLKWISSDTSIATVSDTGLVTAVGNGQVTIIVEAQDGSGVKASCVLNVKRGNSYSGGGGNSSSSTGGTSGGGSTGTITGGTGSGSSTGTTGGNGSEGTIGTTVGNNNGDTIGTTNGENSSGNTTTGSDGRIGDGSDIDNNTNQPVIEILYYIMYFDANEGSSVSRKKMTLLKNDIVGILPKAKRKKYTFEGWYTEKTGGKLIGEKDVLNQSFTAFAHWKKISKPKKGRITKIKSGKSGQLTVYYAKITKVAGYEICYSTNKKFKNAKTKKGNLSKRNTTIKKLKSGKKYYVKVRAYVLDSMGIAYYGPYSATKSITIK